LEEDLGVQLFMRSARSVSLTEEGRTLRDGLVDAFEQLRKTVDSIRPTGDPRLVISCSGPIAAKRLVPRLPAFSARYPELSVRIDATFDRVDINAGAADVALRYGRSVIGDLFAEELCRDVALPLASPDLIERLDVRTPQDLMRVPLLHDDSLPGRFEGEPTWSTWFEMVGLDPSQCQRGVRFTHYADQAIDAAINGGGVLLGRIGLAAYDILEGRLACPFGPVIPLDLHYFFVCKTGAEKSDCIAKFLDWMREETKASIRALERVPAA
jgi:LysR family glycine cleavage system transcriptional activator